MAKCATPLAGKGPDKYYYLGPAAPAAWGLPCCTHYLPGALTQGSRAPQTRDEHLLQRRAGFIVHKTLLHAQHNSSVMSPSFLPQVQSCRTHAPVFDPVRTWLRLCIPLMLTELHLAPLCQERRCHQHRTPRYQNAALMNNFPPVLI